MPDRIELRGLRVVARHGVMESEKLSAQPFEIDLDIEADLRAAGATDDLNATIHYGEVAEQVVALVTSEQHELLERVATRIAEDLLEVSGVEAVEVCVRKLRPPVPVDLRTAAVRIRRP